MSKFGFRVYTFQAFKRKGQSAEDLGICGDAHAAVIEKVLSDQVGVILKGKPDYNDLRGEVPAAMSGDPGIMVRRVEKIGRSVRLEVSYGAIGGHDDLLGLSGATEISGDAAARRFRLDLYYPKSGDRGILVTEVRSRSAPLGHVVSWLRRLEALEFPSDESDSAYYRSIRATQVADMDHLENLIKQASSTKVRFTALTTSTARGRRQRKSGELVIDDVTASQAKALLAEVQRWVEGKKQGALSRTAKALGLDIAKMKKASLDFQRTTIRIEGEEPVSVTPDSVEDVFTYPLSHDIRAGDSTWLYATQSKARDLAASEVLDIEFE